MEQNQGKYIDNAENRKLNIVGLPYKDTKAPKIITKQNQVTQKVNIRLLPEDIYFNPNGSHAELSPSGEEKLKNHIKLDPTVKNELAQNLSLIKIIKPSKTYWKESELQENLKDYWSHLNFTKDSKPLDVLTKYLGSVEKLKDSKHEYERAISSVYSPNEKQAFYEKHFAKKYLPLINKVLEANEKIAPELEKYKGKLNEARLEVDKYLQKENTRIKESRASKDQVPNFDYSGRRFTGD